MDSASIAALISAVLVVVFLLLGAKCQLGKAKAAQCSRRIVSVAFVFSETGGSSRLVGVR